MHSGSYISLLITVLVTLIAPSVTSTSHHGEQHRLFHQHILEPEISSSPSAEMSKSLNVFKKPLTLHSTSPMTGYLRNGYCEVPGSDFGNHAVAAEVTEEFLDFTARQGNDLRGIGGMQAGCKWCLCASRWFEAFEARTREPAGDRIVPKVFLHATNEKALGKIRLEDLKAFAADAE